MAQHFLLSAAARTLSLKTIYAEGEEAAYRRFCVLRWPETDGAPICPRCNGRGAYVLAARRRFKCKACHHHFSVTSGTIFASRKLFSSTCWARSQSSSTAQRGCRLFNCRDARGFPTRRHSFSRTRSGKPLLARRKAWCSERIKEVTTEIEDLAAKDERARRLMTVPGIGPLVATALLASAGDARQFRKARDLAAWLGLVPRQHSTGGKAVLLGISKRGNSYARRLLVHGSSILSDAPEPIP
jgi:hypothetical protein